MHLFLLRQKSVTIGKKQPVIINRYHVMRKSTKFKRDLAGAPDCLHRTGEKKFGIEEEVERVACLLVLWIVRLDLWV